MRNKHFLAAAAACLVVIVAVLTWWAPRLYRERRARQDVGAAAATPPAAADTPRATEPVAGTPVSQAPAVETPATPEPEPIPEPVTIPVTIPVSEALTPDRVAIIMISGPGGSDAIQLHRENGDWLVAGDPPAPADAAKISRLLDALLNAPRAAAGAAPETIGLGDGQGVRVDLLDPNGMVGASLRVGLRPEGDFDSAYMEDGMAAAVLLARADLRGLLGLWRNLPDDSPRVEDWLSTRLVSFDPDAVVRVILRHPDHEFTLTRVGDAWTVEADPAMDAPDPAEVRRWLAELADFRVDAKRPLTADVAWEDAPFSLHLDLDGGETVDVAVQMSPFTGGLAAISSARPGLAYALPVWRGRSYFDRGDRVFRLREAPFAAEDIRYIDVRRDGESVKLQYRGGMWFAPNNSYPLLPGRAERVARAVAGFRPVSPASLDTPAGMPLFGGPAVDVTLADGSVTQYRLGGFHPVFPRRYVLVDNARLFAVDDADISELFPRFSQFLELGLVFKDINPGSLQRLDMATPDGRLLITLERRDEGWFAITGMGDEPLAEGEEALLIAPLAAWRIVGFFPSGPEAFMAAQGGIQIRLSDEHATRAILMLTPQDGVAPVLRDDRQAFTLSDADVAVWFANLGSLNKRIAAKFAERLAAENEMLEAAEAAAVEEAIRARDEIGEATPGEGDAAAPSVPESEPEADAAGEAFTDEAPPMAPEPEPESPGERPAPIDSEPPENVRDSGVASEAAPVAGEGDREAMPDESAQDGDAGEFATPDKDSPPEEKPASHADPDAVGGDA